MVFGVPFVRIQLCICSHWGNRYGKGAQRGKNPPEIQVEGDNKISFAVSCRHCDDPICMKSCIAGAISKTNGVVHVDKEKCVGCYTCVLVCPYGAVLPSPDGHAIQKCELCTDNACGEPACVKGCPNNAIVFEER
jgi:anaerobic carbon-monoxide dehydrogenase iron sulfur subunit